MMNITTSTSVSVSSHVATFTDGTKVLVKTVRSPMGGGKFNYAASVVTRDQLAADIAALQAQQAIIDGTDTTATSATPATETAPSTAAK